MSEVKGVILRRFTYLLAALLCIECFGAEPLKKGQVVTQTGFYAPTVLLEAAAGTSMSHYELGLDFQNETNLGFAGLYLSQTNYDVLGLSDDASMTAIGIRGWQFSSQEEDLIGVDLHLGINRTEVGDYDRTGLEIDMSFYENVSQNTSILLGFTFRPEFLSFDWSTSIVSEAGLEVGLNYQWKQSLNLYSKYYHETLIDEEADTFRIDDGLLLGAVFIF